MQNRSRTNSPSSPAPPPIREKQIEQSPVYPDQQPTARMRGNRAQGGNSISRVTNVQFYQPFIENLLDPQLQELRDELNSHHEVISKLSHVIEFLKHQNEELREQVTQMKGDLEKMEAYYLSIIKEQDTLIKQLQDKAKEPCSQSSRISAKNSKITALTLYPSSSSPHTSPICIPSWSCASSPLSTIYTQTLHKLIQNLNEQTDSLTKICISQNAKLKQTQQQQQYIQAYIQDQLSTTLSPNTITHSPSPQQYQSTILSLMEQCQKQQSHSNSLSKYLQQCIYYISTHLQPMPLTKKQYSSGDLVNFVTDTVIQRVRLAVQDVVAENAELRTILDGVYDRVKGNGTGKAGKAGKAGKGKGMG